MIYSVYKVKRDFVKFFDVSETIEAEYNKTHPKGAT